MFINIQRLLLYPKEFGNVFIGITHMAMPFREMEYQRRVHDRCVKIMFDGHDSNSVFAVQVSNDGIHFPLTFHVDPGRRFV